MLAIERTPTIGKHHERDRFVVPAIAAAVAVQTNGESVVERQWCRVIKRNSLFFGKEKNI